MQITVAAIQFSPKEGKINHNLDKIKSLTEMAHSNGATLVVLPETSEIGYNFEMMKKHATAFPNRATNFLSAMAGRLGIIIVAGLVEKCGNDFYNTAVLFSKTGEIIAKYRKTHLCPIPPINEPSFFKAGSSITPVSLGDLKIGLTICYDCRFPEIYRKLALKGAQIVAIPTAFPKKRIEELCTCSRVRALENQYFVICANHCGKNGGMSFGGRSMIIGPEGTVREEANSSRAEVIISRIDLSDIERVRSERPIFTQRRPELY